MNFSHQKRQIQPLQASYTETRLAVDCTKPQPGNFMITQLTQRLAQELQQALPLINNLLPKRELHQTLQSVLTKMNLVTREEFDSQAAVLQRSRAKLEALEARCTELEQRLNEKNNPSSLI